MLEYKERDLWEPDYHLEFCCRRMVKVSGKIITDTPTEDGPQPLNPKPYLRYSLYKIFGNKKSEKETSQVITKNFLSSGTEKKGTVLFLWR